MAQVNEIRAKINKAKKEAAEAAKAAAKQAKAAAKKGGPAGSKPGSAAPSLEEAPAGTRFSVVQGLGPNQSLDVTQNIARLDSQQKAHWAIYCSEPVCALSPCTQNHQ
jgi:hypothetical protein